MYFMDKRVEVNDVITTSDGKSEAVFSSIVNYFQNCCLFQSEDLGIGFDYLVSRKIGWVLNNWQIDVKRFPTYAERIRIFTNPYEIKGFMGMRNFYVEDEEKNVIIKANSIWTLLNLETMRPAKAPDDIINAYEYAEKLDMDYAPRKIEVSGEGTEAGSIEIMAHHLDMNMHVNNGQYIAMAQSYIPVDFRPHHMRAEYKSQVRLGEILKPIISNPDENTYYVVLKNRADEIVNIVEFKR